MKDRRLSTYVLIILLTAFAIAACAASKPLVERMLPPKDGVKGFSKTEGSLQYGKGDDISLIYNGGYELYTKNGVVDAARQMYERGNDYMEVTIHTMKSEKAALDFLKYWQKENKVKNLTKTGASTGFNIKNPNSGAYFITGKYFTTVIAFYKGDKAKKDVELFWSAIEKKISAEIKSSKEKK